MIVVIRGIVLYISLFGACCRVLGNFNTSFRKTKESSFMSFISNPVYLPSLEVLSI